MVVWGTRGLGGEPAAPADRTPEGGHCSGRAIDVALVVGCARSGTSILGELLGSHPSIRYIFEAQAIWNVGGTGVNDSHRLVAAHATPVVRQHLREWFGEQQGSAALLVEKTPRNVLRIPFLRAVFPEAKIIHIVRDGRDVACSMLPGVGGDTWRHLKPPSWRAFFSQHEGIVRCALTWKETIEIALDDLAGADHLQVRYEDLVQRPQEVASALLSYLRLPSEPRLREFCDRIQDSTQDSYHADRQVKWYREDHAHRIGRWRENMTIQEQETVSHLLGPLLRRLGYV